MTLGKVPERSPQRDAGNTQMDQNGASEGHSSPSFKSFINSVTNKSFKLSFFLIKKIL